MIPFLKDGEDNQDDGPRCSATKNNRRQELVGMEIPEDGIILLKGDNHEDCEDEVVGGKESTERIDKMKESFQKRKMILKLKICLNWSGSHEPSLHPVTLIGTPISKYC